MGVRHPARRGARSLQLAERHLDGIEIGPILGQIAKRGSARFNRFAYASNFMRRKIVDHDDILALEDVEFSFISELKTYVGRVIRDIERRIVGNEADIPDRRSLRIRTGCGRIVLVAASPSVATRP